MAMQVKKAPFDGELLDRLLAGRYPKTVLESEGLIGEPGGVHRVWKEFSI